jgi:hypothetical protein
MSDQTSQLSLISVVGFSGADDTLLLHPDGRTLIYPLGSTVVLRDKNDPRAQVWLLVRPAASQPTRAFPPA